MSKKYCDYKECSMQNHLHHHKDDNTIYFNFEEIYKPRNILSVAVSIKDNRQYLCLSTEHGILSCEVVPQRGSPFTTVEISTDDLEKLRKFLNEMHAYTLIGEKIE